MSAMTKKEWMEYLEKTWDAAQKEAWSEPQFECSRCGHCCKSDLAGVGEVGVWGAVHCESQEEVEDGWCDWVCPKPQGYLMQCCDCELIHEVDFRVVQYEPKPSEVYEVVDDPNLQAQMRLRRRDDISLKKPHQEPVAWMHNFIEGNVITHRPADIGRYPERWTPLYTAPCQTCQSLAMAVMNDQTYHEKVIPKREWVGLTDQEIGEVISGQFAERNYWVKITKALESKLKEKNT